MSELGASQDGFMSGKDNLPGDKLVKRPQETRAISFVRSRESVRL